MQTLPRLPLVTVTPIQRPAYNNTAIGIAAAWERHNRRELMDYWCTLDPSGEHCISDFPYFVSAQRDLELYRLAREQMP